MNVHWTEMAESHLDGIYLISRMNLPYMPFVQSIESQNDLNR